MKVNGTGPGSTQNIGGAGGAGAAGATGEGKPRRAGAPSGANIEGGEKVTISARAKDAAKAKDIATGSPDVNEDKVARLKAAVQNGSYKVDADKVADRLVDDHLSMPF